jgi:hypothetical protein
MLNRFALAGFVASFLVASVNNPVGAIVGIASIVSYIAILAAQSAGLFAVRFTHIPMNPVPVGANSNLLSVIGDDRKDQVVEELRKRSHERLRTLYGVANLEGNPDHEAARLRWLKDRDVISGSEYEAQMSRLRALRPPIQADEQTSLN